MFVKLHSHARDRGWGQGRGSSLPPWNTDTPSEGRGVAGPSLAGKVQRDRGKRTAGSRPIHGPAVVTENYSPFFQAFPTGQVGPANPGDPVANQRTKVSSVSVFQREKAKPGTRARPPGPWLLSQLPARGQQQDRVRDPLPRGRGPKTASSVPCFRQHCCPASALHQVMATPATSLTKCGIGGTAFRGAPLQTEEGDGGTYLRPHVSRLALQTSAPGRALGRHVWLGDARQAQAVGVTGEGSGSRRDTGLASGQGSHRARPAALDRTRGTSSNFSSCASLPRFEGNPGQWRARGPRAQNTLASLQDGSDHGLS